MIAALCYQYKKSTLSCLAQGPFIDQTPPTSPPSSFTSFLSVHWDFVPCASLHSAEFSTLLSPCAVGFG